MSEQPPGPERGDQPQWGSPPQWGEQPQWGDQPQWGGAPPPPPPGSSSWGGPPPGHQQAGYPQPGYPQQPGYQLPPPRPKPGIIPLRPLGLGEIYDGAFQAIRTNPRTMIGLSAVVIAVATLITLLPQTWMLTSLGDLSAAEDDVDLEQLSSSLAAVPAYFVSLLVQTAAVTVLSGMLIVAVSAAVLGRRTGAGDLWARTRRRVPALIGLFLLTMVLLVVGIVVLVVPGVVVLALASSTAGYVAGGITLGLGILIGFIAVFGLYVAWWSCAPPALLLEEQGVIAALRRSMRLVRRSFWRVFGIQLLTLVLAGIASSLIAAPFSIAATVLPVLADAEPYSSFGISFLVSCVDGIGQIVAGAIISPFQAAVTALLYIDLRMRREGLDLELIRASTADAPVRPQ